MDSLTVVAIVEVPLLVAVGGYWFFIHQKSAQAMNQRHRERYPDDNDIAAGRSSHGGC